MKNKVILVIDYAAKTGWALGYNVDGKFNVVHSGKFKAKGVTEKQKVRNLEIETVKILSKLTGKVDEVLFEDSFAGSGATSNKTLRSTYGKRYLLIDLLAIHIPDAEIYSIKPTAWWKQVPNEFRLSSIEFTSKGIGKTAKGKEKKENSVKYANQIQPRLNLVWDNERVNCDNDIADAVVMGELYCNGKLDKEKEWIG